MTLRLSGTSTRWSARRSLVVAAVAAATLLAGAPAAASAPSPTPTPNPSTSASPGKSTKDTGNRTWGVRPAGKDGKPDARTHFTLQATQGATVTEQALVNNLSPTPVTFSIYGTDAFNTAAGQFDLLTASKKPTDLGSWIVFPSNTITVAANGSLAAPFTVKVPPNATPGDHAAGVVVSLITLGSGGDQNVNVDSRVAVRVYLRIPGNLQPRLAVGPVSATYRGVTNPIGGGRLDVAYTVSNPGNIRLRAKQTLTVTGPFGMELKKLALPDLPEILPGQSSSFTATVDDVFPAGPLTATVELAPYPDPEQPVGQEVPKASASADIWAMPWLLLGILLILLIALTILWWFRRRRALSRLDKAMMTARAGALAEAQVGAGVDATRGER